MFRYAHILITPLFLFFLTNSFAQYDDLEFEHITIADGLPDNNANDIVQDYLGFIWIGTNSGLVKYDGSNMNIYCEKPNDTTQLIGSTIFSIYEDKDKNLWIGHSNGVSIYDRDMDSFQTYLYDPNNTESYGNAVANIFQDHSGKIWIMTYSKGLIILIKDSLTNDQRSYKILKRYIHNSEDSTSLPSNTVFYTYETIQNIFWLGGFFGLSRYNSGTDNFITYDVFKERKSTYPNAVVQIFQYKSNDIWFATYGDSEAFGIFNHETEKTKFISLHNYEIEYYYKDQPGNSSNGIVREVIIDVDGTFWIPSLGGGLIQYNPKSGTYKSYLHDPQNPKSISFGLNQIGGLCKDYSGVIWLGVNHAGINRLSKPKPVFKHIQYDKSAKDELGYKKTIYQIYEDGDGILWLGTLEGLSRFDRKTGTYIHYIHDPEDPFSICNNRIIHILEDKEGFLWIATDNGLSKFDKNQNRFTNFYYDPDDSLGLPSNNLVCLIEDSEGDIFRGTSNGVLSKYSKTKNRFINFFKPQDQFDTLGVIGELRIDEEGLVWFTSGGNLNKFHPEKGIIKKYYFDDLFVEDNASGLYYDSKSRFWMGRRRGGLLRFDKQTETYKVYSNSDGLPDESVGSILEDSKGRLWIRTGTSICRFDPEEEVFKKIIDLDSYQYLNTYAAFESTITGEMYFAGDGGFYIFHPDSIQDNPFPPRVVFTDIKVFDESIQLGKDAPLKKHINVADQIILNHWQNDFTIEFVALHFVDQKRNQYKYMLDGYDEHWREGDVSRLARYTNMSPGDYVFTVIASNSDGVWNEEGASIKIIILSPWWATNWAYIIYAIIILNMIYFTWKLQIKRIRIKHDYEMSRFEAEKMHEVDEMKSRFFANISHEFRTPLTLIFGPVKDISEKTKEADTKRGIGIIKRNASRLYGLVNQLLDLSKLESGKMKLEANEQNILPLLKGIFLSFSSLAERRKITLRFDTKEQNLDVYIDRDKLEKIINNLLSNAFKFTPEGGKIDFTVKKLINDVEIKITDNGIGIPKERIDKIFDRFYQVDSSHTRQGEGTGIGLALTKELVELHKGKIKVDSREGEGTIFTIQLPLGKNHLKPEEIVEKQVDETISETEEPQELTIDIDNRKEKTDIDVLLDPDKPLLLVVEDNSDVRSYIISHLEGDYRIQEAVDGEDGIDQAMNHIPDLIISDVMMPKMDGFEMCDRMKKDERTSHIPVIMLTAKATSKDKIEGYETGADDYIMKPFDAKELKVRIKNLIEIRKKLQQKFSSDGYSIPQELGSIDEQFIKRVLQVINEHISEEEFSIEKLGKEAAMSRMHLHRKLKALTGKSPSLFIRSIRLNKAKKLIKENRGTIAEIAYDLGFGSPAYFTKCFKEEFGYLPSEFI